MGNNSIKQYRSAGTVSPGFTSSEGVGGTIGDRRRLRQAPEQAPAPAKPTTLQKIAQYLGFVDKKSLPAANAQYVGASTKHPLTQTAEGRRAPRVYSDAQLQAYCAKIAGKP